MVCITFVDTDAPKEVFARKSSGYVEEGNSVTLSCSAKGHPPVTFNWFKDDQELMSGQEFIIQPVKPSDSGLYFCEAKNEMGTRKSRIVEIDVLCEYFLVYFNILCSSILLLTNHHILFFTIFLFF